MTRWCGVIGYAETLEIEPGVWSEEFTERKYYGDLLRNSRRLKGSEQVNDDITISNQISILADPYAVQHFHAIRYAELFGTKWKVSSVEVQYPRLILELGGIYNA